MDGRLWVAAERVPMVAAAFPDARFEPGVTSPERERAKAWTREDAIRELVRGRLEVIGPTTSADIAGVLGIPLGDVDFALGALAHFEKVLTVDAKHIYALYGAAHCRAALVQSLRGLDRDGAIDGVLALCHRLIHRTPES